MESTTTPRCSHVYVGDPSKLPRGVKNECPYPALFDGLRRGAATSAGTPSPAALPMDAAGACIFHSHDSEWKRQNEFTAHFIELIALLNGDPTQKYFDFREFVFVGGSAPTAAHQRQPPLRIATAVLRKQPLFNEALFLDSFELVDVQFPGGVTFAGANFTGDLKLERVTINGFEFGKAKVAGRAVFSAVEFGSYAFFNRAEFRGRAAGQAVTFEHSHFEGITDFSHAVFDLGTESSVRFSGTRFDDGLDFSNVLFRCQVVFEEVSFAGTTEFIDTSFEAVQTSARYRGSAVEFNRIDVTAAGSLTFRSSDTRNLLFKHDVEMTFRTDPAGTVLFAYVDFSKFGPASRDRLLRLAKTGNVVIGSGCIKYRHRTDLRTVPVSDGNSALVIEICQTFTNYFTASNGLNLGLEIVDRGKTEVSFFYYSDEDISPEAFRERLAETERELWSLVSARSDQQRALIAMSDHVQPAPRNESALINAVDAVSALLGTFFRVGARVALDTWKQADTRGLLNAIQFNDDVDAEGRARGLHEVFVKNYTGRILVDLNAQQNRTLPPMTTGAPHIDFVILTAIEVERRAVCAAFGIEDKDRIKKDGQVYWRGDISTSRGRSYEIVVAQPVAMGNIGAALLAADALRHWHPTAALLVGIAASADPSKVLLGDVVVGKSVWYYEHGKVTPDGKKPQPDMIPADSGLLKHLAGLPAWNGACPVARPGAVAATSKLHADVIASGEKVIADAAVRDEIASEHRKILAIEMEGYGFSQAIWQSNDHVRHLVIRGICDDGSPAKDDKWHGYAASAAAVFARHFLVDGPL